MATDTPADQRPEYGVWIVESEPGEIGTLHPTELDALRAVNDQGYGRAIYVPWGLTLWEAKEQQRKEPENADRAE